MNVIQTYTLNRSQTILLQSTTSDNTTRLAFSKNNFICTRNSNAKYTITVCNLEIQKSGAALSGPSLSIAGKPLDCSESGNYYIYHVDSSNQPVVESTTMGSENPQFEILLTTYTSPSETYKGTIDFISFSSLIPTIASGLVPSNTYYSHGTNSIFTFNLPASQGVSYYFYYNYGDTQVLVNPISGSLTYSINSNNSSIAQALPTLNEAYSGNVTVQAYYSDDISIHQGDVWPVYWKNADYLYSDGILELGTTTITSQITSVSLTTARPSLSPCCSSWKGIISATARKQTGENVDLIHVSGNDYKFPEGGTYNLVQLIWQDNRGKTYTANYNDTLNVTNYDYPIIVTSEIRRCTTDVGDVADPVGEFAKVRVSVSRLISEDNVTISGSYKIDNGSAINLQSVTAYSSGTTTYNLLNVGAVSLPLESKMVVTLSVSASDGNYSTVIPITINYGFAYLELGGGNSGLGIGLGSMAMNDYLTIGLPTVINGSSFIGTAPTYHLEVAGSLNLGANSHYYINGSRVDGYTANAIKFKHSKYNYETSFDGHYSTTITAASLGAATSLSFDPTNNNRLSLLCSGDELSYVNLPSSGGGGGTGGHAYTLNADTINNVIYLTEDGTAQAGITVPYATMANGLNGLTASITELNYCDGVTSNIQAQLNNRGTSIQWNSNTDKLQLLNSSSQVLGSEIAIRYAASAGSATYDSSNNQISTSYVSGLSANAASSSISFTASNGDARGSIYFTTSGSGNAVTGLSVSTEVGGNPVITLNKGIHSHSWSEITGKPTIPSYIGSGSVLPSSGTYSNGDVYFVY